VVGKTPQGVGVGKMTREREVNRKVDSKRERPSKTKGIVGRKMVGCSQSKSSGNAAQVSQNQ